MLGQTQPGDLGDSNCISQLSLQIFVAMQVHHVQGQSQLESYVVACAMPDCMYFAMLHLIILWTARTGLKGLQSY